MENDLSATLEMTSIRNYVKSVKESDPGVAHERGAIMKLYAMQARYVPLPAAKPEYMKRLMNNQVAQLDMKPGGKFSNLYSNKKSFTLDDKFSSNYLLPKKASNDYKLRPINNLYKLPHVASVYGNSLENTTIGYQ